MDYKMNNDFFDEFDVLFSGGSSIIAGQNNVLGYYATQALRMDSKLLLRIDAAIRDFKEEFQVFLSARDVSSAAVAQQKLNELWSLLGELPAYDILQKNDRSASHLILYMRRHPDEVDDMITPGTERNRMMNDWLKKLDNLTKPIELFIRHTKGMVADFFEELPSRRPEQYAKAYETFRWSVINAFDMQEETEDDLTELAKLQFRFPVRISYEGYHNQKGKMVLAEKIHFEDLVNFLYVDFFKGMAAGNIPRQCRNCGKYFLAMGAYDTLFCNEIAPGETVRTCRKVGAHKREKVKTNSKPILQQYNRVYNRLKARKRNGLITEAQWNEQVAHIQELKEAALKGKITDAELTALYDKI